MRGLSYRLLVTMHGLVDIMRLDRGLGLLIFMVMILTRESFKSLQCRWKSRRTDVAIG